MPHISGMVNGLSVKSESTCIVRDSVVSKPEMANSLRGRRRLDMDISRIIPC